MDSDTYTENINNVTWEIVRICAKSGVSFDGAINDIEVARGLILKCIDRC